MLPFLPVLFGEPATALLAATINLAKGADPLAPVTVIVPSNSAGLSLRRTLGATGLVNVRFLVMARVAELIGAPSLAKDRVPLTAWARAEAIRAALLGHNGVFKPTADHPATIAALDATFRDLRRAPEGGLDNLAANSHRGAQLVALFREFRALSTHTYDNEDVAHAAAATVMEGSEAIGDVGHSILFLPRSLSPGEEALVRELQKRGLLDIIAGVARDPIADQSIIDLAERFGIAVNPGTLENKPLKATRIVRAIDVEEEVRTVIRLALAAATGGTPFHRIAVFYPSVEMYGPLLQEQFRAAGIPINGPPVRSLSSSMAARVLLGMLALPTSEFRRDAVMEWLTSGPIIESQSGSHPGQWVSGARWDEASRDAGIVKGARQWGVRLDAWVNRPYSARWDAEVAQRLGDFIAELEHNLRPPATPTMASLGQWALGLLDRYLGSEITAGASGGWEQPAEVEAYQAVRKVLTGIAASPLLKDPRNGLEISVLDGRSRPEAMRTFRSALEDALGPLSGRLGRFGEGVFIGSFKDARGMSFDHVFLVGMVEGVVPAATREDPLLPDAAREHAALPPANVRRIEARADYLAALASACQTTLCFPQSNLGGQGKNLPSRWLLESASALAEKEVSSEAFELTLEASWLVAVASFENALRSLTLLPASVQEWELRSLDRDRHPRGHFLAAEPSFGASLNAATVRLPRWSRRYPHQSTVLSEWAGNIGAGYTINAKSPSSPTAFETLASCPYKYFLRQVGRVKETNHPEAIARISAADRGNVIHDTLEKFLSAVKADERSPGPDEAWSDADRAHLLTIADAECALAYQRGITGSELLWRIDRARIRRDLTLFLAGDASARAQTRGTFFEAEHRFGYDNSQGDSWDAVTVKLPAGQSLAFRGRIDRVDRGEDGRLIVYDYKSGGSSDYAAIDDGGDRLAAGTRLQLPIYAIAARQALGKDFTPVGAYYWFTSEREGFKRIGYDLTDADELGLSVTLGVLAQTAEAGLFPPVPGKKQFAGRGRGSAFKNCQYCEYDRICVGGDRQRAWEEARVAPSLAAFVELAEGPQGTATVGDLTDE